jgi:PAS domain S-box-containing protein
VPTRGPGGKVNGCIALSTIVREVTWAEADIRRLRLVGEAIANALERVRVERELRESECRYRATFERAAVGILNVAKDGRLLVANQRFCEMLGYSHEEVIGGDYWDFTHPDDLDPTANLFEKLIVDRDRHDSLEKRYLRKDGDVMWGKLTLSFLSDDDINSDIFVAVIEDLTIRKQAEETFDFLTELQRSEAASRTAHEEL